MGSPVLELPGELVLLQHIENIFFRDAFVGGHQSQDGIQGSNPKKRVVRDGNSLVAWNFRFKDDVASGLVKRLVVPVPAEAIDERPSGEISGQFQARAKLSSLTRCSRTDWGAGESKK